MAREVDPEGTRTIGDLMKVDLMYVTLPLTYPPCLHPGTFRDNLDKGTDVVDILAGRIIPLRLGYVLVVNRGQWDIETNKSISAALENERDFFENHSSYKTKAQCSTPFLARKLNMVSSFLFRT
jgi:hypothetical protein